MEAARWWAGGGEQDDSPNDLAAFGATATEIQAAGTPPPAHFAVWTENWEAVQLFTRLSTQWRYGGMGGVIGLDYAAVEAAMRMIRIKPDQRSALLEDLQVMEGAALGVMNKGG